MKLVATKDVPVADLRTFPGNPRQGDVGAIVSSLQRTGQFRALVVRADSMEVLAGNHTLLAMRELGWESALVHLIEVDGDAEAKRIVLADNRTSDLASYDDGALVSLLTDLAGDLEGTGYDGDDLDDLLRDMDSGGTSGDTEPGAPPAEPTTRLGDLIVLGEHRLLCGDSTNVADVERLMDGSLAQMVFTDPPYGVDYEGGRNPVSNVPRDRLAADERGTSIYADVMPALRTVMDDHAALYLWFAGSRGAAAYAAVTREGLSVRALIIWHKLNAHYGAFMAQYMPKHEPMLYCVQSQTRWHGPTNEVTVWEHDQPARNEFHPTEKPVALAERAITNSSSREDVVVDLFAGSGTTLIAAENLGRRCYALEIDPRYADVIVDRWERHTGKTAERIQSAPPLQAHA